MSSLLLYAGTCSLNLVFFRQEITKLQMDIKLCFVLCVNIPTLCMYTLFFWAAWNIPCVLIYRRLLLGIMELKNLPIIRKSSTVNNQDSIVQWCHKMQTSNPIAFNFAWCTFKGIEYHQSIPTNSKMFMSEF